MGCLNSTGQFSHWFGNIHLSGPCNRSCYFCIGQHMMALDPYDTLGTWPLPGLDSFVEECEKQNVQSVYVTGTNTDPLLYRHTERLVNYLQERLPGRPIGVRTNGAQVFTHLSRWIQYSKASVTICSLDPAIYRQMMGSGAPPDLKKLFSLPGPSDVKINIVLGPENTKRDGQDNCDVERTCASIGAFGPRRINLREPYGQPHVGDPLARRYIQTGSYLGMPVYQCGDLEIVYWDVHYVEVESVNLYASGRVSTTYPITKGCSDDGQVIDQTHFMTPGRVRNQWLNQ